MTTFPTVQIQAIGRCNCKPAGQLEPGDVTMWNYGGTYTFAGFIKETKAQVIAKLISNEDGSIWEKRMGKERLVAVI